MRKVLLLYKKLCRKNNGSVPIASRTAKYSERKEMQELISAKYFFTNDLLGELLFFFPIDIHSTSNYIPKGINLFMKNHKE